MIRTIESHTLRLRKTMTTAHGSILERHVAVVTATDGRASGSGEVASLPGFGLENQEAAIRALRHWVDTAAMPESPAARTAVATAMENLDASRNLCSLAKHLATDEPLTSVATQAVIGDSVVDETVASVVAALERGFTAIKVKVAVGETSIDIERITQVRRIAGDGVCIRLDANGGWDRASALLVMRELDGLDIDYVEEPTPNPGEFGSISSASGVAVALDEHARDPEAVEAAITVGGIAAVVLKPAVLGGPRSAFELGTKLLDRGVRVIVGSFMDGWVGLEAAIQVAAALRTPEVHGLGTAEMFIDPFPASLIPANGQLSVDRSQFS